MHRNITRICGGLLAAVFVLGLSSALQGDTILQIIDLGMLGGTESRAYGLNSNGDVTGSYINGGVEHAFVWHDANANNVMDAGEMQDLGTLGGARSAGYAINDAGQVAGWADLSTGAYRAFRWTDGNANWADDPGEMVNLGTLGLTSGTYSVGYGINNAGQVAGLSYLTLTPEKRRAFRWTDLNGNGVSDAGEMRNIGTVGGARSQGFGINTQGDVVGLADDILAVQQSFRWIDADADNVVDPGEVLAIPSLLTPSTARDVNDAGGVAGYYSAGAGSRAYYYDSDGMVNINTLLGATESWAYAISDDGMVCGSYMTATGAQHGFVYDIDENEATDVNDLLPTGSGWVITSIRDMEGDLGCGWGTIGGEVHALLGIATEGTVLPEPMSLMLVGSGLLGLLWRRRRS